VAAGVVRHGDLLWHEGIGSVDLDEPGRAPGPDDQFLIASITKTFTAVMVMQLRDEGRLSLDDTLERFLPDVSHHGITVRQMLAHASGMQREPVGDVWETLELRRTTLGSEGARSKGYFVPPHTDVPLPEPVPDPKGTAGGVVLMNASVSPDPAAFAVDLADHVLDHEPEEPSIWQPGTDVPQELAELTGRWYSEGQPFDFSVRQGRLEA
jgi:hypothetical protein